MSQNPKFLLFNGVTEERKEEPACFTNLAYAIPCQCWLLGVSGCGFLTVTNAISIKWNKEISILFPAGACVENPKYLCIKWGLNWHFFSTGDGEFIEPQKKKQKENSWSFNRQDTMAIQSFDGPARQRLGETASRQQRGPDVRPHAQEACRAAERPNEAFLITFHWMGLAEMIFGRTHSVGARQRKWKSLIKDWYLSFPPSLPLYIASVVFLGLAWNAICIKARESTPDLISTGRANTSASLGEAWPPQKFKSGDADTFLYASFFFFCLQKNLARLQVGGGAERLSELSSEWLGSFAVLLIKAKISKEMGSERNSMDHRQSLTGVKP